jgi:hypothetical protein
MFSATNLETKSKVPDQQIRRADAVFQTLLATQICQWLYRPVRRKTFVTVAQAPLLHCGPAHRSPINRMQNLLASSNLLFMPKRRARDIDRGNNGSFHAAKGWDAVRPRFTNRPAAHQGTKPTAKNRGPEEMSQVAYRVANCTRSEAIEASLASPAWVTPRLRFLDSSCVVPTAVAIGQVDGRFGKFGHSLGLAVATSPESRATPSRELVNLGRPLSHIRIDHFSPLFDRGASLN